ncbi:MAG: TolC family protein [Bryobacteraceae bacterium]
MEQSRLKVLYAELDYRKKKSEYIPDVGLSVSYHSAVNISGTLPRNVAIAGVQASWEPFDWGRKRSELAQKEKGIREAGLALKEAEDKIRIEVGNAYRKMREAQVMLSASVAGQENTREAARLATARFRNQAALLKDVLEAQADMAGADNKAQQALVAFWSASAELEMAMGEGQ